MTTIKEIAFKNVVDKMLSQNEEIKYQFSLGERYLKIKKIITISLGFVILLSAGLIINHFFEVTIIALILILVSIFVLLVAFSYFYFGWFLKRTNIYLITDKRIIIHRGWFSSRLKSVGFQQITDIKIMQPFFDRVIFKIGTLKINTAGMGDYEITLSCVENPYKIKTKIIDLKYSLSEQK